MTARRARPPRRRASHAAAVAVLALALSATACSPSVPSDNAQASPTAETTAPSPSDTASASASPSPADTATPSSGGTPTGTPSGTPGATPGQTSGATPAQSSLEPSPTGPPPVLDRAAAARDLTMADFFAAPVEWRGGQFDVGSERGMTGLSGPLRTCATDEASGQTFELRLANNFSRISMRFGEANDSENSDAEMLVRLVGNGTFIDSKRVKFNKLESIQVPVNAVNALKIQVFMTGKGCDENKVVNAVLSGVRLE